MCIVYLCKLILMPPLRVVRAVFLNCLSVHYQSLCDAIFLYLVDGFQ